MISAPADDDGGEDGDGWIVSISPPEHARNGQIIKYEIQFWKGADPNKKKLRETTEKKTVFANLDDNTE